MNPGLLDENRECFIYIGYAFTTPSVYRIYRIYYVHGWDQVKAQIILARQAINAIVVIFKKGLKSDKQIDYLASLKICKYKTLVSCDYDEIVIELTNCCNELRFSCTCCSKVFKTKRTLDGHFKKRSMDFKYFNLT